MVKFNFQNAASEIIIVIHFSCILVCLSLSSCEEERAITSFQNSELDSTLYYLKEIVHFSKIAGDNFLPIQYFTNDSVNKIFLREKLSHLKQTNLAQQKFLAVLKEPDLAISKENYESYRLTWLRSFDRFAFVIRIDNTAGEIKIMSKKILTASHETPNVKDTIALMDSSILILNDKNWVQFKSLIENCYFWDLGGSNNEVGYDGSWWTLEGSKTMENDNQYHKVTKWSPGQNSFREACEYMIILSGFDVGNIY